MQKQLYKLFFIVSLLLAASSFAYSIDASSKEDEQRIKQPVRKKDILDINSIKNKHLDISYAPISEAQKLDIYLPDEKKEKYPVIIFIHGGAWMSGDKRENFSLPILRGLKEGYAVISINYRLSEEATFPAAIEDVKAAIRFIRANANKYNLDAEQITLFGRSSGANLATLAGVTSGTTKFDNPELGNSDVSSSVHAVVAWFPPINLLTMDKELKNLGIRPQLRGAAVEDPNQPVSDEVHGAADSPASLYMGRKLSEVPELVNENNPTNYISENTPHFFIEHGTSDNVVPYTQSVTFAEKLKEISKNKVEIELVIGAKHGGPAFTTEENLNRIYEFINSINQN